MAASSSSSAEMPESREVGFHPSVVGRTGLSKMADDSFTEGLRLQLLQGRHAVILIVDPNTGKVVDSLSSAPEMTNTVAEIKMFCEAPDSAMSQDLDKILGKRKSFATTADESRGQRSRTEKMPSRSEFLSQSIAYCKKFFGTIKPAVHATSNLKDMERYLRLYAERGHPIPSAVLSYLNNEIAEMLVESTPWEVPIIVTPPNGLSTLLPLMFDPLKPTSAVKQIFNLQVKDKNNVSIKERDGRKGVEATGRAAHARSANRSDSSGSG